MGITAYSVRFHGQQIQKKITSINQGAIRASYTMHLLQTFIFLNKNFK